MLNIGGDQNDRSYRYKMPRLDAKVEGRGNGIKTRIVNCSELASSLHRDSAVVGKFFGCALGAQTTMDGDSAIVTGEHNQATLQEKLCTEFIPKFVLCPTCGLPETDMKVRKAMVRFNCAGCGAESWADETHKLCKFIVSQSKTAKGPKEKKPKKEKGDKEEKQEKKSKKDKKSKKSKKEESSDEVEWHTDCTDAAVEARRLESMTGQLADLVADGGDESGAPAENTQEAEGQSGDDKSGESAEEPEPELEPEPEPEPEPVELEPEPEPVAASCNPAVQKVLDQLCAALNDLTKSKEINKAWTKFVPTIQEANLSAEDAISLVMNLPDNVAKNSALVLKTMYDEDILEEAAIVEWHKSADQSLLAVSKANAFVEWLTAADEDSDE